MIRSEALGWAAQAWCRPETSDRVMDPELAKAFADILVERCEESVAAVDISRARQTMRFYLWSDPGLHEAYVANISAAVMDRIPASDPESRKMVALDMLQILFGKQYVSDLV